MPSAFQDVGELLECTLNAWLPSLSRVILKLQKTSTELCLHRVERIGLELLQICNFDDVRHEENHSPFIEVIAGRLSEKCELKCYTKQQPDWRSSPRVALSVIAQHLLACVFVDAWLLSNLSNGT